MKGTSILLRKAQNYRPKYVFTDKEHEVKFRPLLPLKVSNKVSSSGTHISGGGCIQEMYNMMACLKNNDFEQTSCSKEIQLFTQCNRSTQKSVEFRPISKAERKKVEHAGQKNISTEQLNKLLKKFPT